MKLNYLEKAVMNNRVRAFIQKHHEAAMLERFGGRCDGATVLEIGCGRGVGTEIIFERFGAKEVQAFDLDPDMVELARQRLAKYSGEKLRLSVGDAERIEAADASFDAVFDFGIIHHVPNWQNVLREVSRVLKPGGKFYFEEVTAKALNRWFYRTFFEHPRDNRFTPEEFIAELSELGIVVGEKTRRWFLGDLFVGVGNKI
jgi:ubiquinone/menaquinone biosynthesis C-methylase UbiE